MLYKGNNKSLLLLLLSRFSRVRLCDPIDGSPAGSSVPGILQSRILEWVAISFSNTGKWKVKVKSLSRVRLFATPWTAAYQAPPPMGFSRQEYWSGVPLPSLNKSLDESICLQHGLLNILSALLKTMLRKRDPFQNTTAHWQCTRSPQSTDGDVQWDSRCFHAC